MMGPKPITIPNAVTSNQRLRVFRAALRRVQYRGSYTEVFITFRPPAPSRCNLVEHSLGPGPQIVKGAQRRISHPCVQP